MMEERYDSLDKNEWWDVAREAKPDLTREDFDRMLDNFIQMKEFEKKLQ